METQRKGQGSEGEEGWDAEHREYFSDLSKGTTGGGGRVRAEFSSPGCRVLWLSNEWLFLTQD